MNTSSDPVESSAIDPESRLTDDHHDSLRLWLRLLTCTSLIERRIRVALRRVAVIAEQHVGRAEMKEAQRMGLRELAEVHHAA